MKPKVGARVLVSEDCREGGAATGQVGTYEGDFPLTVAIGYQANADDEAQWHGEFDYAAYKSGELKLLDGTVMNEGCPEWEPGKEQPRPYFAMPMNNPRIRLDDGSVIWGCECWWGEVVEGVTLEQAQQQTEEFKALLRAGVEVFASEDKTKGEEWQ